MSFINNLQMDLANTREPIEGILLRGKILAHRLKSKELGEWINNELDGYSSKENIPEYRTCPAYSKGQFINAVRQMTNVPIPLAGIAGDLDPIVKSYLSTVPFGSRIAEIEHIISTTQGELTIPWKASIIHLVGFSIFDHFQLISAHFVISRSFLQGIVSAVRNRFLSFSLALEESVPDLNESYPKKISQETLKEMVNVHIYESNVAINSSTFQQNS